MRPSFTSLLLILSIACPASEVLAHAVLVSATPQVGSVVTVAPSEVRLGFSEGVEPRFSGIEITSVAGGQRAPAGRAQVQGTSMVAPLPRPLPPGVYRVHWH